MGNAVIELDAITKLYGAIDALAGVDLSVEQGEVIGILGPNGAGKTTAISIMLGLRRPSAGAVRVFGEPPESPAVRGRIGAMLQESGVPGTLTVEEIVRLFSSYYPYSLPVERILGLAGLSDLRRRRVSALSGGQRQRLYFALAICGDPDLLFLDEPTTGMDVESRQRFWTEIRELASLGKTLLFATHFLEEADALASRIVVIDHGRVVANGTPAEIKAHAGGKRIRVRGAVDVRAIESWPGVRRVDTAGAYVVIQTVDAEDGLRRLFSSGQRVDEVTVDDAELESAFLNLTAEVKS
jgi:ABC-2 type transport system ATP-binding protein